MKAKTTTALAFRSTASLAALLACCAAATAEPFTYQCRIDHNGSPASGVYDLTFTLWDSASDGGQIGSTLNADDITVINGLAAIDLDFGTASAFNGDNRWLEISVKADAGATYNVLSPRQAINPTPYALHALSVDSSATPFVFNGSNAVFTGGRVGIGTSNPVRALHLLGSPTSTGLNPWTNAEFVIEASSGDASMNILGPKTQEKVIMFGNEDGNDRGAIIYDRFGATPKDGMTFRTAGVNRMEISATGSVGIGTSTPQGGLSVTATGSVLDPTMQGVHMGKIPGYSEDTVLSVVAAAGGGAQLRFYEVGGSNCRLWLDPGSDNLKFDGPGLNKVSVPILEIRGGADIVEGFETAEDEVLEPGTVVSIDPANPGALTASDGAYDLKVAGVVSGAGGVSAGMHLGQDGVLDGDTKVAMTGRVYVKCSTENGSIKPGDRLTTSSLAGHAMKATDNGRSDGSVIGKAMSELDEETGLVLVLVNLQ